MPYRRAYTMDQVHTLICDSEGRSSATSGQAGHPVSLHADGRTATTADLRSKSVIYLAETIEQSRAMNPADGFGTITGSSPGVDSRFTTRLDLVRAVCQALNGSVGQSKLSEFDTIPTQNRITFTAPLTPSVRNIERFTKVTSTLEKGLKANSVFLVIDRFGPATDCAIHLQTAFPKDVTA